MKNCIILAAGKNTRLETGKPKSLIELNGEALLGRHIRLFANAGVSNICVVTGAKSEMIESYLKELKIPEGVNISAVFNSRFDLENGFSLSAAKDWLSEQRDSDSFFLTMGDHVYSAGFISFFVQKALTSQEILLAVDLPGDHNAHIDFDDVTKVKTGEANRIQEIGKTISNFDYYDTGLFRMRSTVMETMKTCFEQQHYSLSHVVKASAMKGLARVLVMEKDFTWADVDNTLDLEGANELVRQSRL